MMTSGGGLQVPKSQFPSLGSPQRAASEPASSNGTQLPASKKVALAPGHSLMDWVRLGQKEGRKLNGVGGQMRTVSAEELASHNKVDDAWMSVRGKVYNVTPYMSFHPGGEDEMMRGAGSDGTQLFDDVHQWVNVASMLEKCYIGQLRKTVDLSTKGRQKKMGNVTSSSSMLAPPAPVKTGLVSPREPTSTQPEPSDTEPEPMDTQKPKARYDWYQNAGKITVTIYAKCNNVKPEHLVIDRKERDLQATVILDDHVYTVHIGLFGDITNSYEGIRVIAGPIHRIIFVLNKSDPDKKWMSLGTPLDGNNTMIARTDKESVFRQCKVLTCQPLTRDIKLFGLELPPGCHMSLPMGYHVHLRVCVNGDKLSQPYTAVSRTLLHQNRAPAEAHDRLVHLMIKIYPNGQLTQHLERLREGDSIEVSDYEGNFVESRLHQVDYLTLVAAGTGFTPMVRLLLWSLRQQRQMRVKLLFFNKTEADIPWKDELRTLTASQRPSVEVVHVLSQPDQRWTGPKGRIRPEILDDHLVRPTGDPQHSYLMCICGPTPFTQLAFKLSKAYGYTAEMIHVFAA